MDEKATFELLVRSCMRATDDCLKGTEIALNALLVQSKLNKKQKQLNRNLAAYAIASTIFAVVAAAQIVEQRTKLKQLELRVRKIAQGKESNECNA